MRRDVLSGGAPRDTTGGDFPKKASPASMESIRITGRGEVGLEDFFGLTALYTLCTDISPAGLAVDLHTDLLQVRYPAAVRDVMSVTDVMTCYWFLSTYGAYFTHCDPPGCPKVPII